MLNIKPYNNKEQLLFPASVGDYITKNDLVHVVDEAVETIDLTLYYRKISPIGNPAYDPAMLIKLWFYGYCVKTISSRKIADRLNKDVAFIYLAGMQKPDFRTISDFRKNNLSELKRSFIDIVKICHKLGLTKLGEIAIDSKIMKANASADKSYNEKELQKEQESIEKSIAEYLEKSRQVDEEEDLLYGSDKRGDELPEDLQDKEKRIKKMREIAKQLKEAEEKLKRTNKNTVNLIDTDAQFQKDKGRIIPGYRGEVAVDSKEQIIITNDVVNEQDDHAQLLPIVDEVLETIDNIQNKPNQQDKIKITADSNYSSGDNLSELEKNNYRDRIDPYIPDQIYQHNQKTKEESLFDKDNFIYDKVTDEFTCPAGKKLYYSHKAKGRKCEPVKVYRCNSCVNCGYFGQCTRSPKGRMVKVSAYDPLYKRMREKLSTPEGKEIYRKRKIIVEPVFGNLSQNLGFREFVLRDIYRVKGEFSLMCTAHNLLKISKYLKNLGKNLKEVINSSCPLAIMDTS